MLMGSHVTTSLMESLPAPLWTGSKAQRRIADIAMTMASHAEPESDDWRRLRVESNTLVAAEFGV
jgi:hypothetical protein